jgi:hypothetical protein
MKTTTKKPKRVYVFHEEVIQYTDKYECPSCKSYFNGFGISHNITRFKCQCGQELIAIHMKNK